MPSNPTVLRAAYVGSRQFRKEPERREKFFPQYSEPLGFPIKEARRALHLFSSCSGLVEESLTLWGYSVIRLYQKFRDVEICCDIMDWDFRAEFLPGHFNLIAAGPRVQSISLPKRLVCAIWIGKIIWCAELRKSLIILTPLGGGSKTRALGC